jgi:hypothetical protein
MLRDLLSKLLDLVDALLDGFVVTRIRIGGILIQALLQHRYRCG